MPLLHLDSSTRINSNEGSGASEWQLASSIRFRKLRLVQASVPVSFYTVANGAGLSVQLAAGVVTPITISTGIKTLTQLATAIQTGLRNSGLVGAASFAVISSAELLTTTFTFTSAFSLIVTTPAMSRLTGLAVGTHASIGNGIVSQNLIELAPTHITITSRTLGASPFHPSVRNSTVRSPLYVLPLDVPVGSMLCWNERSYYRQEVDFGGHKEVAQLAFELRNPQGEVLDPGLNWSVILEYTE